MSNLEFVKFQNLYIRVADNLVTGIIFPHSGQFTHLLQNEELLEGKFSYLAKNEGLLTNFILQLNYILSKKGLTERSLYEALSNAYPTGSSDMTPIQVSVSENVPPPYPPGYAVRVEYASKESTTENIDMQVALFLSAMCSNSSFSLNDYLNLNEDTRNKVNEVTRKQYPAQFSK